MCASEDVLLLIIIHNLLCFFFYFQVKIRLCKNNVVILLHCGVVNFVPAYLPPMNGLSKVKLILVYFDKDFVRVPLVYVMKKTIYLYS